MPAYMSARLKYWSDSWPHSRARRPISIFHLLEVDERISFCLLGGQTRMQSRMNVSAHVSDNIFPSFTRELMRLNNSLLEEMKYLEIFTKKGNYM